MIANFYHIGQDRIAEWVEFSEIGEFEPSGSNPGRVKSINPWYKDQNSWSLYLLSLALDIIRIGQGLVRSVSG